MALIMITHCGAGSTEKVLDASEKAGKVGSEILNKGGSALDAVVGATIVLEDDERLNAGTGSRLRLSGKIQMDASLMDSKKDCGCVAALEGVKNPIKVAREVMKTPHLLIAGEGANEFARSKGFEYYDPKTDRTVRAWEKVRKMLREKDLPSWAEKWEDYDVRDTVGAVALDSRGGFATSNSTGGTTFMLDGRVGDTPVIGAGLYAAEKGAVSSTGIGEEIVKVVLSKWVSMTEWLMVGTRRTRAMHPWSCSRRTCPQVSLRFPRMAMVCPATQRWPGGHERARRTII